MDLAFAAQVHHREQKVSQFRFKRRLTSRIRCAGIRQMVAHFSEFLRYLSGRARDIGPVESDASRTILKAVSAVQGREPWWQSILDRGSFARFHPLPRHLFTAFVQMRVPGPHLRDQSPGHICHGKGAAFFGDHGMEEDLEQDVPQLLPDERIRGQPDRFVQFRGFLDQVRSQGFVGLSRVPLAAGAEIAHERERIFKCGLGLHSLPGSAYTTRPRIGTSMRHDQRRAWIEVDLGALKRNALMLAHRARVPLLPMVKADAYGLGVDAVVWALEHEEPWGYGVATIEEGAHLRSLGVSRPILVFTPLLIEDFDECRVHQLTPTLGDARRIAAWNSSGGEPWHLGIDTGMNRAGIPWQRAAELRGLVEAAPPEGAFTHFHSAEANDDSRAVQEERFAQAIASLPARPRYLHAENSPAIERISSSRWDLARPGVALYGVGSDAPGRERPEPVAALHARIVEIRDVADGETVSYGGTWRATGWRRIATAAAGYADGVRRSLSNRGAALVCGTRAPIAGTITMDMAMLDVTGIECAVGDIATFVGRDGNEEITVEDFAVAADLSPYEVLVGLGLRAPRIYLGGSP